MGFSKSISGGVFMCPDGTHFEFICYLFWQYNLFVIILFNLVLKYYKIYESENKKVKIISYFF